MQHNFPTPRKIFHFWGTFSHELLRAQNRHFLSIDPYMDGSVFEVGIQMGGNFVYFTGIVMGVYLKLVYAWVVKTGF